MASCRILFKCEHRNERSDIIFHIYFINSEKRIENDYPRGNSNFMIKLVVAHNSLRLIHLIDLSKRVKLTYNS
jgi:hypothetical protein